MTTESAVKPCAECGRLHCHKCSERYKVFSAFVDIARYWEACDGVSHIVAKTSDSKERVLCSSDLFETAKSVGRVPVRYGLAAS